MGDVAKAPRMKPAKDPVKAVVDAANSGRGLKLSAAAVAALALAIRPTS